MTAALHQDNDLADSKLASGVFASAPRTRARSIATQSLGTHQENAVFIYELAPECVVAPKKPDLSKLPGCSELRKQIDAGKSPALTAQSFIESPTAWGFKGDNRSFTNSPADGLTNTYRTSASVSWSNPYSPTGSTGITRIGSIYSGQATATVSGSVQIEQNSTGYNRYIQFAQLSASASDPFFMGLAPAAEHSINAMINFDTGFAAGSVSRTDFPALQIFVGDQSVYQYSANANGKNPLDLRKSSTDQFSAQICDPSR